MVVCLVWVAGSVGGVVVPLASGSSSGVSSCSTVVAAGGAGAWGSFVAVVAGAVVMRGCPG